MTMTIDRRDVLARGPDIGSLDAIRDPGCALAIWDRRLAPPLAAAIARLDLDDIDDVRATVPVENAELHVAALLTRAGYPAAAAMPIAGDIALLATRHADWLGGAAFTLRLEVIETDACRRFHADMVTTRLIVTYRGPGTQWIEADSPDRIDQVATGAVAVFKGRLLADDPPILHRSPPIAATGDARLLLVIDPGSGSDAPIPRTPFVVQP